MADFEQVDNAATLIEDALGPIDVRINVAFTSVFAPFAKLSPAEFRRVTEVSYLGFVHGTMAALSRMRSRDHGTIVPVGSALSARSGNPAQQYQPLRISGEGQRLPALDDGAGIGGPPAAHPGPRPPSSTRS